MFSNSQCIIFENQRLCQYYSKSMVKVVCEQSNLQQDCNRSQRTRYISIIQEPAYSSQFCGGSSAGIAALSVDDETHTN